MVQEIAHNVFIETRYHGANVAYIPTGEGIILIDTPMLPNDARAWLALIEASCREPILYIINTDHHRAHIIGNQFFPMARVLAHEHAWKEMKSYGDSFRTRLLNMYRERNPPAVAEWRHLKTIKPQVTFTGRCTLFKGDKEIHLIAVGGHTPATIIVFFPNEKILFSGDVVITDRPPFLSQGNTKQWLEALTYLRKLRYDVLIPGHGEPTGKEATDRMSEFLRLVRRHVRSAYLAGLSKSETASSLSHLIRFWPIPPEEKPKADRRFKSGLGRVWNEVRAEEVAKSKGKKPGAVPKRVLSLDSGSDDDLESDEEPEGDE
jgi:cyclase